MKNINKNKKQNNWRLAGIVISLIIGLSLSGCGMPAIFDSEVNDLTGEITGNTYDCKFYSNTGDLFMTVSGEKIDMNSNIIQEPTYNGDGEWGYVETVSSVITLTIDGDQIENCGSTIIFAERGLEPDKEYSSIDRIESSASGIGDNTMIANVVNKYKNMYGKPTVVVIQSQLGNPICAFSGEKVYWEVCEDLPKTTKLMIDGKALYIHRANFQIIDKKLL